MNDAAATSSLPHSDSAERAVLAGVLLNNKQFSRVAEILGAADFYSERHRQIFRALGTLVAGETALDLITLRNELERTGELEAAGGVGYLTELIDGGARSVNVGHYARIVKDKSVRRAVAVESERLGHVASNGSTPDELAEAMRDARGILEKLELAQSNSQAVPTPVNLYDTSIVASRPAFTVKNFIREVGLHLWWAAPSGLKTWLLLTVLHELCVDTGRGRILGHPHLWINRRYNRVLWIATEEDAPTLRYKAEWILRGLNRRGLNGEILYMFAAAIDRRVTLDNLPEILERCGPFEAIVLDSLTGLRPRTVAGERVKWDIDNEAGNEMCLRLRGLADKYKTAIHLVHHSDKTGKQYRGATDWWASSDVMVGLLPEDGLVRVEVQKNRDGARVAPFLLEPFWGDEVFTLTFKSAASGGRKFTPTCLKVNSLLVALRGEGKRTVTQAKIVADAGASRSAVLEAIKILIANNMIHDTGLRVNGSPVYGLGPGPSAEFAPDTSDAGELDRSHGTADHVEGVRKVSASEADTDE